MIRQSTKRLICIKYLFILIAMFSSCSLLLACKVSSVDLYVGATADANDIKDGGLTSVDIPVGEKAWFYAECTVTENPNSDDIVWEFDFDGNGTYEFSTSTPYDELYATASETYNDPNLYDNITARAHIDNDYDSPGTVSSTCTVTAVGVEKVVGGPNSNSGPLYVIVGATVDLEAIPEPDTATFPDGEPTWEITSQPSGSDPNLSSSGKYATFSTDPNDPNAPGDYVIEAACGTDSNSITITVFAVEVEITTPYGDPSTTAGANSTNERTFNTASPGVLTVPCVATPTPDTAEIRTYLNNNRIRWTVDPIGSSTLSWSSSWPGDSTKGEGLSCTATFTTLPADNTDFGPKEVKMEFLADGSTVDTTDVNDIEVFYDKTSTNNPGGSYPNWFYYWNAVIGDPNAIYKSGSINYGLIPAMVLWSPTMTYSKTEIWIYDPSAQTSTQPDSDVITGIDCFLDVIKHEGHHIIQISQVDALLGGLNGQTGSIWLKGWSFTQILSNHWTLGVDGKAGVANVDDDSDGPIDEVSDNSEVGFAGSDDVNLDTDDDDIPNTYESATPAWFEPAALALEDTIEHANASSDWGDPGKRHATVNTYDD